ncbi:MAG: hypothetical protein ACFFAN_09955 [Promethearchaeota archaeon]
MENIVKEFLIKNLEIIMADGCVKPLEKKIGFSKRINCSIGIKTNIFFLNRKANNPKACEII